MCVVEGRGRDMPVLGVPVSSRVLKSVFGFVLESAVRWALRSVVEAEGGLAEDTFETTGLAFAFGVFVVMEVVVVVGEHAWRVNEEAEGRVIDDDALDLASITDLQFSCFSPAEFVFFAWGDWQGTLILLEDASCCSVCPRRWPCI
jgi:hypothetical protein